MQNYLDQTPNQEIRLEVLFGSHKIPTRQSMNNRADRRMNINYEIVTRICCGTTCVTSEEYILGKLIYSFDLNHLGTVPLNAVGSPLRLKTRTERKKKGASAMLPPHRKVLYFNLCFTP